MIYRSVQDLSSTIARNLHRLPRDIDLVVGIPRSGLLAANLLALHLNLPLADLEGFKARRLLKGGSRAHELQNDFDSMRKVLVVDDSVYNGTAMGKAKRALDGHTAGLTVWFAAVFVSPAGANEVDYYFEVCKGTQVFEWNLLHHTGAMAHACVEIDGVLCEPPTEEEPNDEEKYVAFLGNARRAQSATRRIGYIVTNRHEKYRAHTEKWLKDHGFSYGKLVMRQGASPLSGVSEKERVRYKADVYFRDRDSRLFIERSLGEASGIANLTGKMVYCMETREMIYPSSPFGLARQRRRKVFSFLGNLLPGPVKEIVFRILKARAVPQQ